MSTERLTDPLDDSESYYWTPDEWARLSAISRAMLLVQQTLAGRVVIGSFWRIAHFFRGELRALINNEKRVRAIWIEHLLWCIPVILWLTVVCRMPLWIYVVAMVLPANGVILIRSFAEHRARPGIAPPHCYRRACLGPGTPISLQQSARAAPRIAGDPMV